MKKKCNWCKGTGVQYVVVNIGNPYSYHYELRQDTTTIKKVCTNCKGTGKR